MNDFAAMATEEFVAYVEQRRAAGDEEAVREAETWARSQPPQRIVGSTSQPLELRRRNATLKADLFVAYVEAKRAQGDVEAVESAESWIREIMEART